MQVKHSINSEGYWDDRFVKDWGLLEGPAQSRFFARLAIENLPRWIIDQLQRQSLTLCDWGCAQGDGADVWAGYIDPERITGIDFSSVAIEKASQSYPGIRFLNQNWLAAEPDEWSVFDVVFSSNTLEHFHKPYPVLQTLCSHAEKAVILALPYQEVERHDEHFYTFLPQNIPSIPKKDFSLMSSRVVDCSKLPDSLWGGKQIILVYAHSHWVDSLGLTLHDLDIEQSDLKAVVINLNQTIAERDGRIANLNQTITERDGRIANLNQTITERDGRIANLNQTITERDGRIANLNQAVLDRQAELMKMSDWAYGMMEDLKRAQMPLHAKLASMTKAAKQVLRRKLAKTVLGDLVRHIRESRRYYANMASIDAIRRSLHENNGRLIITFPIITWDFRWQRPQHIVSRLRDNGYSIVYLAMSMAPLQRRFLNSKEAGAALQFNNLAQHINQIWLHSRDSVNIYNDSLAGDDLHNLVSGLRSLLTELKPKSIHYLLHFPGWWPVAEALRESHGGRVVFDCMDDHSGFSTNSAQALKTEQSLIEQADLVIASSSLLESRCKDLNRNTIQVNNGTEFHHFHESKQNGELDHLKGRTIIGYYGAISDWFDMELVAHCAKQRPQWQFVLIGATFGADLSPVDGLSNVHFLGEKPYAGLPGYLAYFDVCTIPFKLIPLTLATNPVKFYEYLSAGKPVVSVDLPELMPYSDDCYLAGNAEQFLEQLERALEEKDNAQKIARRFELARANSWDARVQSILVHSVFN